MGQAHQLTQVLRLRSGDDVSVFDGSGREVVASLATATPRRATARILREAPRLPGPGLSITLAQVVPRGAAMDLIVAKTTELGVARLVPLEGERSVRRASGWLRIAQVACDAGEGGWPLLAVCRDLRVETAALGIIQASLGDWQTLPGGGTGAGASP